jgi:hypothetical protein
VPLPSLRPSLEGPMNLKTFRFTEVSQCRIVSWCVPSISFPNKHIFCFFLYLLNFLCLSVTLCHSVVTLYSCHVSLVIKSVIRGLLVTNFNQVLERGGGQKVSPRPLLSAKCKKTSWAQSKISAVLN